MAVSLLLLLLAVLAAGHFASVLFAGMKPRRRGMIEGTPPVTLIRPLCGVEPFSAATLRSSFELDYPDYEIIFCVERANDPVLPLVNVLIAQHPHVPARVLIGADRINANPKLNNLAKGWRAAKHGWIVMTDSNVLLPRDHVQRMLAEWDARTGLVCSPPLGVAPEGIFAEAECAFLNSHQARWQYAADFLGEGFAQGKSMLWRREVLDAAGGIEALGLELAEDAAATKLVRGAGLNVRLARDASPQPLGTRSLAQIWQRQLRWARLRRDSFLIYFLPEILTGFLPALLLAGVVAKASDLPAAALLGALAACWYGAELLLIYLRGWHLSWTTLPALVLRDFLMPAVWIASWFGNGFVWHGNAMTLSERAGPA